MTFSNPWFTTILIGLIGWFHLKLLADLLNLKRLSRVVPAVMRSITPC